jgi:YidC/Oxa1 family membrane protein insertase
MMMLLPLFFVIFIVNFPAGLIIYWITTNTWTLGQQWVIRRRIGPDVPVTPTAPVPPSGGRGVRLPGTTANGDASGGGGGLAGLLGGKPKSEERQPAAVGSATRTQREAPPPPPHKKKRSGRRR